MTDAVCALIANEALVDYWADAVDTEQQLLLEEHAFTCDHCSHRLQAVGELVRGIPRVARRRGGLDLTVTPSLVAKLQSDQLRLRHYHAQPGERVACTVGADDDMIVAWLGADLQGVGRVDVVVSSDQGGVSGRLHDVPVDRASNQVVYTRAGEVARRWPDMTVLVQVVAVDGDRERLLGEYHFDHTGFAPGR